MAPPDVTHGRTSFWSFSKRKPDSKVHQAVADVEKPRSKKRGLFSSQKHVATTPRAPDPSEEQARTPNDASSPQENHRLRAGPEYAPTVSTLLEVTAQSPPASVLQAVNVVTEAPGPRKGRPFHAPARLFCIFKRVDDLKDTKADIRQTGQMIRARVWTPRPGSSLSLGEMARAAKSSEAQQFLEAMAGDFREFKKREEEKRLREKKEREERAKILEEMEVVDTVLVQSGPFLRRVQRLQPASMKTLGTLDPYAVQSASMSSASASVSTCASSSSSVAGSSTVQVMERSRGVERRPRDPVVQPRKLSEGRLESNDGSRNRAMR